MANSSDNYQCSVGNYYLYDNQWNCGADSGNAPCGPESAYGCTNPDGTVAWVVNSNQRDGNTAVLTYPDMQENFPNKPLGSFHEISATFAETSPPFGSHEAAFDIWLNNQDVQVMVWVDRVDRTPPGTPVPGQMALGGQTYQVWQSTTNPTQIQITYVASPTFTSGNVNLLEFLQDAAPRAGFVFSSATVSQINFGVEIASTGGKNAMFEFNDFSILTR
jgi:hypothetical protein